MCFVKSISEKSELNKNFSWQCMCFFSGTNQLVIGNSYWRLYTKELHRMQNCSILSWRKGKSFGKRDSSIFCRHCLRIPHDIKRNTRIAFMKRYLGIKIISRVFVTYICCRRMALVTGSYHVPRGSGGWERGVGRIVKEMSGNYRTINLEA